MSELGFQDDSILRPFPFPFARQFLLPKRLDGEGVTFSNAMTNRENVRKNLESILPELKKRWEEWRRVNLNK